MCRSLARAALVVLLAVAGCASDPWWHLATGGTPIVAFATPRAVYPGDSVPVFVRTAASRFRWELLRIGDYGSASSRSFATGTAVPSGSQPPCVAGPDHLLDCGDWHVTFHLDIGSWPSGVYLLRLTTADGGQTALPVVVGRRQPTDYLAVIGVFTFQAYNTWGGHSLYDYNSQGQVGAQQVSFRRPYDAGGLLSTQLGAYDAPILQWLDHVYGSRVSYETDFELDAAAPDPKVKAVILVGHDEYVTFDERAHLAAAVANGHPNLASLGANDLYWQARLGPAPDGTPHATLVCYRDATLDPVTDPSRVTIRWRDLGHPANAILGVAYVGVVGKQAYPATVVKASDALFAGTGVHAGDDLGDLVGYEADGLLDNGATPAGIRVLTRGGFPRYGGTAVSNATFYTAPSGTRVFAAGSMEWGFGLGPAGARPHQPSAAVERLTENALDALAP